MSPQPHSKSDTNSTSSANKSTKPTNQPKAPAKGGAAATSGSKSPGTSKSSPVPPPDTGGKPRSFAPKTGSQPKAGEPVIPVASKGSAATGVAGAKAGTTPGKKPTAATTSTGKSPAPAKKSPATATATTTTGSAGSAQGTRQYSSVMSPTGTGVKARPDLGAPRRIRLAVNRIDPWSAMKFSLLLSLAFGIMMVVASIVFWNVLDGLNVFTEIDAMVKDILGEETEVNILQYVELSRVISLTTIIAVVDVVLLTAIGTIGAFLYNVVASLVGGLHLTLTDD